MSTNRSIAVSLVLAGAFAFSVAMTSAATAASFQTTYSFAGGGDGESPFAVILDASGNLYGTTFAGGTIACQCGTIFRIAPDGTKTTLYAFKGKKDGAYPLSGLTRDGDGNLYGTTNGTAVIHGTVFKLTPSGHFSTLHTFKKSADGRNLLGSVIMDRAGNLYGTTSRGGHLNLGTVYKITPQGEESVLHSFVGRTMGGDGANPVSALILDRANNLYGTTTFGGGSGNCGSAGCGTVFKVSPDGTTTVLYAFRGKTDGQFAVGSLAMDRKGNLYGMTQQGGNMGDGQIFKLTPEGAKSELYSFKPSTGSAPQAGLIMDRDGNLYGTAQAGSYGQGVAFELMKDGTYVLLHEFTGGSDGHDPAGNNLTLSSDGALFGATVSRPGECCGTVFKIER